MAMSVGASILLACLLLVGTAWVLSGGPERW